MRLKPGHWSFWNWPRGNIGLQTRISTLLPVERCIDLQIERHFEFAGGTFTFWRNHIAYLARLYANYGVSFALVYVQKSSEERTRPPPLATLSRHDVGFRASGDNSFKAPAIIPATMEHGTAPVEPRCRSFLQQEVAETIADLVLKNIPLSA